MSFSDDDLKRFATICDDKCHCRGEAHDSDCPWLLFKAMKARLEAAENCICVYNVGTRWFNGDVEDADITDDIVRWRKAAGK